ncbi:hypothetical protein CDAR_570311 [Caerostris darwini]|uniref:Uncharacterized protein n=1 Tax=Caerostris darwini TaxID=1538125 RepID=A0AAV4PCK5_9ARAC|nr:hypothetical protein CDAR_570311 [Caerostris darwini]
MGEDDGIPIPQVTQGLHIESCGEKMRLQAIVQIAFRMGLKDDYFFHLLRWQKKTSLLSQRIGREKCSNYSTLNIGCYFASPDRRVNALILLTQAVIVNASCRRDYHALMSRVKNKKNGRAKE